MINSKIISGIITLGIITILLLSGPAEAFVSSIEIKNNKVDKGQKINIDIKVGTENEESPSDVSFLIFKLNGPTAVNCKFLPNGNIVSGCKGIIIKKKPSNKKGYCKSLGYGPGCSLEYNIIMSTKVFEIGTYSTSLLVNAKGKESTQKGDDITIILPDKGCSLRASNGIIEIEEKQFKKNKLSFYVPIKRASNGNGYLFGQEGKDSLTYRFNVDKILDSSDEMTKIRVTGKYRIGIFSNFSNENAVITIDKVNNITSIVGSRLNVNGMKINFKELC